MNFHDHITLFDTLKREHPNHPDFRTPNIFYKRTMREFQTDFLSTGDRHAITGHNQSYAEYQWFELGKPYFKVYPNLLPMFMKTKLTVPGKYLHAPFSDFLIRLPENHGCEELIVRGHELKTIFVTEASREDTIALLDPITHTHMFIVWINFGEMYKGYPYYLYQVMKFHDNQTIEEALVEQRKPERTDQETLKLGLAVSEEEINNCIRLVVSTCFLATGADRIVEPDILTRDLQAYIDAKKNEQTTRVKQLHDRAQRRGKKGWTLGREMSIPRHSSVGESEPTGEHLLYQHQRGAHFHVYHYGPGKSQWKVEWIRQLTVRPDLPLPPVQAPRGYKAK